MMMLLMPLSYSSYYCCCCCCFLLWYCCLCVFSTSQCLLPPMFSQAWILFVLVFMKALITHTTLQTREIADIEPFIYYANEKQKVNEWDKDSSVSNFIGFGRSVKVKFVILMQSHTDTQVDPKPKLSSLTGDFELDCALRMGKQIVVYHSLCVHLFFIVINHHDQICSCVWRSRCLH